MSDMARVGRGRMAVGRQSAAGGRQAAFGVQVLRVEFLELRSSAATRSLQPSVAENWWRGALRE